MVCFHSRKTRIAVVFSKAWMFPIHSTRWFCRSLGAGAHAIPQKRRMHFLASITSCTFFSMIHSRCIRTHLIGIAVAVQTALQAQQLPALPCGGAFPSQHPAFLQRTPLFRPSERQQHFCARSKSGASSACSTDTASRVATTARWHVPGTLLSRGLPCPPDPCAP